MGSSLIFLCPPTYFLLKNMLPFLFPYTGAKYCKLSFTGHKSENIFSMHFCVPINMQIQKNNNKSIIRPLCSSISAHVLSLQQYNRYEPHMERWFQRTREPRSLNLVPKYHPDLVTSTTDSVVPVLRVRFLPLLF